MSDEILESKQIYQDLRDKREYVEEGLSRVVEEESYFKASDLSEEVPVDIESSEVGKMLVYLSSLGAIDIFNPDTGNGTEYTYVSRSYDEGWFSEFVEAPERAVDDALKAEGMDDGDVEKLLAKITESDDST
jgi:hypothetical protein